jgi:hypothetical protein
MAGLVGAGSVATDLSTSSQLPLSTCALRFQAVFKVGYAAIDEDTDGLTTGLESAAAEPTVRVRDLQASPNIRS